MLNSTELWKLWKLCYFKWPFGFSLYYLTNNFLSLNCIHSLQDSRPQIKCLSHLLQSFLEFCRPRAILPRTQALLVLGIFVRPSCQLSQCPCKVGILWAWLASVHIRRGWEATQHHQATHSGSEWTHTAVKVSGIWKYLQVETKNIYKLKLFISHLTHFHIFQTQASNLYNWQIP